MGLVSVGIYAQEPALDDVNSLLDYAEQAEPGLFSPPAETAEASELGTNWYYRLYAGPTYAAINRSGGAGFAPGDVYVLGGAFGATPVFIDSLANLLTLVQGSSRLLDPGNGNCIPLMTPSMGTTAIYSQTETNGQQLLESSYTDVYNTVAADQVATTRTRIFIEDGDERTEVMASTDTLETQNDLLFLTSSDAQLTITTGGQPGSEIQTATITYIPGQLIGPAGNRCEGQSWFTASVSETVTYTGEPTEIQESNTSEYTARVESIDTELEVPAGTFTTVHTIETYAGGQGFVHSWHDVDSGLLIESITFLGENTDPDITITLTELN